MTIYTTNTGHDSDEWYRREMNTICSPMLQVRGDDDLFEFCCWTFDWHLICAFSNLNCVVGQAVLEGGGCIDGVWYTHCVMVRVRGASAWNRITALFDDWILGPVWGKEIVHAVLAAEAKGW